jgi:hypothetical protein
MDELDLLLSETKAMTTEQITRLWRERAMFHPPLPGSLLPGAVICRVPFSAVKYASFLEWWFAVGRKAPELTRDGWAQIVGPYVREGEEDAIPREDWEKLEQREREAIREWAEGIDVGIHFTG